MSVLLCNTGKFASSLARKKKKKKKKKKKISIKIFNSIASYGEFLRISIILLSSLLSNVIPKLKLFHTIYLPSSLSLFPKILQLQTSKTFSRLPFLNIISTHQKKKKKMFNRIKK